VAIRNISRVEFNQFLPERMLLVCVYGEQFAWWADHAGSVIGTIAGGTGEGGWRCITLQRGADGGFRVRDVQSGFDSREAAGARLVCAMETAGKNCRKVFR
jgi:hypothetical protein